MGTVILYIYNSGPEQTIDFQNDSDLPIVPYLFVPMIFSWILSR